MQQSISVDHHKLLRDIKLFGGNYFPAAGSDIFENNPLRNSSLHLLFRPLFPSHMKSLNRKRNRDFHRHSAKARRGLPDSLSAISAGNSGS